MKGTLGAERKCNYTVVDSLFPTHDSGISVRNAERQYRPELLAFLHWSPINQGK